MHSFEELNAKINRLKRDGGVGYTESKRVSLIDWGNYPYGTSIPGELFGEAGELLLRSRDVISNEELESIAIWRKALPSGHITDENFYTKESLIFDETEETRSWRTPEDMLAVVCFLHDIQVDEALTISKGTYILRAESPYERVWTSEIHYKTETIHPISDKYLPEGFGGGGPVVIDLDELGVMAKLQDLMKTNGGLTTLTIDPDKLWNKVRNAPQIICKFPFQENKSSGETFNAYLTGWYHVPATRMDFIETGRDAVSITFTFVAMNSFARVTLAQNVFGLSADENGLIYSDVTEVLLDLYPLTPAPGNY